MKTFRSILKKKLTELGYPVEISKFYVNHRVRCLGKEKISKNGIRIKRESYPEYTDGRSGKYYENIFIDTNGYIKKDKIEQIIEDIKKEYNHKLLSIYIYD